MSFRFVQITDHHLMATEATLSRGYSPAHALRCVLRHIAAHHGDVDFLVSTGDLVERGIDAEYATLRAMLGLREYSAAPGPQRATGEGLRDMPCYFLPGNHDPRAAFFRNMFPWSVEGVGEAPAMNAAFVHKGVQFVCVDWGAANKAASTPAMLEHLRRSLATGMPSIVLSHHNVTPVGVPRLDALAADDVAGFAAVLGGGTVLAILAGHTHMTYEARLAGVPVLGLRSTHFSFAQSGEEWVYALRPPQYRVVTVDGPRLSSDIVEVAL
ncbi:MAG: metallophosphoesterase [Acetobacteraceae bacterium]|nr:metallophosphoesterase [Acetobacteraceae bacterium]